MGTQTCRQPRCVGRKGPAEPAGVLSYSNGLQVEQELQAACKAREVLRPKITSLEQLAHAAQREKAHVEAEATRYISVAQRSAWHLPTSQVLSLWTLTLLSHCGFKGSCTFLQAGKAEC